MGICKSRQTSAGAAKKIGGKVQYHKEDTPTTKVSPKAKSWSRLRDEAALNPDAKPFVPQPKPREVAAEEAARARPPAGRLQSQVLHAVSLNGDNRPSAKQVRAERQLPVGGHIGEEKLPARTDDPEWMQSLGHRLAASKSTKGQPQTQPPPQLQPQPGGDNGSNSNFVLRTDEYMKLLHGGSGGNQRGRGNVRPIGAPRPPDKPATTSVADGAPSAVGLGQMWTNAFSTPAVKGSSLNVIATDVESTCCTKPRQFLDDTFLERFLDDRDFSEQAYWSDGGDGVFPASHGRSALISSAHAFRRGCFEEKSGEVRSYVMQDLSQGLDEATALLLGRVQYFNEQLTDLDPVSPRRRLFIGLKEVFRRLKQGHVKVLIVAPDLEGSTLHGGVDDRMRELLAYAYQHEVPVIFALSRKRIGRALGKNLNISILGIVDVTGARELCDKALGLANEQRLAWLDRAEGAKRNSTTLPRK